MKLCSCMNCDFHRQSSVTVLGLGSEQSFPSFQCVVGGCPDLSVREFQHARCGWPWILSIFNGSLLFFLFEVREHSRVMRQDESLRGREKVSTPSVALSLRAPPFFVHSESFEQQRETETGRKPESQSSSSMTQVHTGPTMKFFKFPLKTLQWGAITERHVALNPLTEECVHWSSETFWRAWHGSDGFCVDSRTGTTDGVELAHQRTSWRADSRVRRLGFGDYDVFQWVQLQFFALFLATGTVEVAAS